MTKQTTTPKSTQQGKPKYAKDGNGLLKNPKTPAKDRPADYKGVGAPSFYRHEHCEKVIELGKLGKSLTQMAAELDVARATLDEWAKVHTEFSTAITRAMTHSQNWWETIGQTGLIMPKESGTFNAAVWTKSVSCRFPESYTDKSKNEHTGADGGAIKHDMSIAVEFIAP